MLKSIVMVTILVSNLGDTEKAYSDYLDYDVVERGKVSKVLAENWGAPSLSGERCILMQPESDENVYLRFIQDPQKRTAIPMQRTGWNATEILVEDPDALAEKFKNDPDSPFKIIGGPDYLTDKQNVKAMQVFGPSGEMVYLTNIIDPSKSAFNLGRATSFVDRVFIMVLGTHDVQETKQWYETTLGEEVLGPYDYKITVLSKTYDLPEDTIYPLSMIQLPSQFMLEIDQYPEAAIDLNNMENNLPPGILMVSFLTDEVDGLVSKAIDPPDNVKFSPYNKRETLVLRGNSGELIELIESN